MNAAQFLGAMAMVIASDAYASDFNIESTDLIPLSTGALRSIKADLRDPSDFATCRFVGRLVDLDGDGKQTDWVATTADGCDWGAAAASIWVLAGNAETYRLVLSAGGADLTIGKAKKDGLRHISISSGTAGHYEETLFKFNGSKYIKSRSRFVDLSNPEDCRKNRDVCRE
jgi:hypothetical protein